MFPLPRMSPQPPTCSSYDGFLKSFRSLFKCYYSQASLPVRHFNRAAPPPWSLSVPSLDLCFKGPSPWSSGIQKPTRAAVWWAGGRGRVGTEPILGPHRPQTNFNTSGHFWNFYFLHRVNQMPQRTLRVVLWGIQWLHVQPWFQEGSLASRSLQLTGTILCPAAMWNGSPGMVLPHWFGITSNFSCIHRSCITWESYCSFLVLIHSEAYCLTVCLFIYFLSVTPPVVKVSRKEWP